MRALGVDPVPSRCTVPPRVTTYGPPGFAVRVFGPTAVNGSLFWQVKVPDELVNVPIAVNEPVIVLPVSVP